MNRRDFLKTLGLSAASALTVIPFTKAFAKKKQNVNILFFTADDLNCDSVGCFGGKVPDLTPNLDAFAAEGMRFDYAHITVSICQPSRGVLATGLYGHNSGIMGFMHTEREIPTIMQTLRDAGYLTAVLGKVGHSTPHARYKWDFVHDQNELGRGRDPDLYYKYCKEFLTRCRRENKQFYFMVNSHDPHRPYHIPGKPVKGAKEPSKIYKPDEVAVPGFVPDLPGVRQELSYYLNSVRRLDDTFGKTMQALRESGFEKDTLVMFLSDNGIAIPFAKCNAYLASTRTPWIVRWPGVVKKGTVDKRHFISGIDFFPTVLEAVGLPIPHRLDGFSFLPLLKGGRQAGREKVFTQIDMKAGGDAVPMRCVQDKSFGYIFSPWADGKFWYRNNNEGLTMKAMVEAAKTDPSIAQRVNMFRYRAPEELYDLKNDPDCIKNLVDSPDHKSELKKMRRWLHNWMKKSRDPLLSAFENRNSPEKLKAALVDIYGQHYTKPANRKRNTPRRKNKVKKPKDNRK
ncbi:MAG: sulfatase-like hydrolase/transferase [Phycisphaerae bacterium]|nr:sulfatase [Phycisphaerae bacterium]NIP52915.1 sulfatase [Phycisphaerae bacterium]NIS51966.1 sulfatase [Phycisphaerae bacterium]NIU09480.1 sulfatase [Phycisphaerae bacterium]NIU58131.1 sulfatase-like hydrolase/transferase [Phycisphaerae bacterium]